jgi:hypothetical protein
MFKNGNRVVLAIVLFALALAAAKLQADESIVIRSGNGALGSHDAQVRFLDYGGNGDITPTAQNFISVQTGPFASVVAPYPTYVQHLPTDPLAQWISTAYPFGYDSALYAIPFVVTDPIVASATLDLGYAVDNAINGVYINGLPISGNSHDGDYHGEYYFLRSDIAPLLKPNATNWLYLNVSNYGYIAALIFNATITVQGSSPGLPTISPNSGGNTGNVTVRVIGSGFQPNAQLELSGIGPAITASNVTVVSPNILTGTFDLSGAAPGIRNVAVTNPDNTSLTLPNAFTVTRGGSASLSIQTIGTPAVLGRNSTIYTTLTNTGTIDSGVAPVVSLVEPWFSYVSGSPTPTSIQTDTFPSGGPMFDASLEWDIPNLAPGESATVAYTGKQDPDFPVGNPLDDTACNASQLSNLYKTCYEQFEKGLGFTDNLACKLFPVIEPACRLAVAENYAEFTICMELGADLCSFFPSNVRGSVDPNDLTGPHGYGNQQWISSSQPMQYALSFTNLPTATKPATTVSVTDAFDRSTFDLSTLSIGAISFGNSLYTPPNVPLANSPFSADIDLRPAQNLIVRVSAALDSTTDQPTVNFSSLDPSTGLPPADPLVGFLAPGESGTVLYTVKQKPALTTGTNVQDSGSVIFDVNAALATNTTSNLVDNSKPTSGVVPLTSSQSCPNFKVSWSGSDLGSGLSSFTIYASDSGGPFKPWMSNINSSFGVYPGAVGHTYSFYSIATDNVGNIEPAKTTAEASTRVIASGPCSPPSLVGQLTVMPNYDGTITVNLQITNTGETAAEAVTLNQIVPRTLSGSGVATLTSPNLPLQLGPLAAGGSTSVSLLFNVPSTLARFSLTEDGTVATVAGQRYNFSIGQVVIP